MTVRELSLPDAEFIAARLCATHRADVLREFPSVSDWARNRVAAQGSAWVYVGEHPIVAGGVETSGDQGLLWLAGIDGWTRYIKHAIRYWRAILSSGAYRRYVCEVSELDPVSREFAERMGFRAVKVENGLVLYGVTP